MKIKSLLKDSRVYFYGLDGLKSNKDDDFTLRWVILDSKPNEAKDKGSDLAEKIEGFLTRGFKEQTKDNVVLTLFAGFPSRDDLSLVVMPVFRSRKVFSDTRPNYSFFIFKLKVNKEGFQELSDELKKFDSKDLLSLVKEVFVEKIKPYKKNVTTNVRTGFFATSEKSVKTVGPGDLLEAYFEDSDQVIISL